MTGGIAQAYYDGIPDYTITNTRQLLDEKLKVVIDEFYERYGLFGG